jgi:hypothetical protein
MGRRKIKISPITDDRNRSVTFLKRKNGLFKKAYELGVLCNCDVAVIIFGGNGKLYEYASGNGDGIENIDRILLKYSNWEGGAKERKGVEDFREREKDKRIFNLGDVGDLKGKGKKKVRKVESDDEDEEDEDNEMEMMEEDLSEPEVQEIKPPAKKSSALSSSNPQPSSSLPFNSLSKHRAPSPSQSDNSSVSQSSHRYMFHPYLAHPSLYNLIPPSHSFSYPFPTLPPLHYHHDHSHSLSANPLASPTALGYSTPNSNLDPRSAAYSNYLNYFGGGLPMGPGLEGLVVRVHILSEIVRFEECFCVLLGSEEFAEEVLLFFTLTLQS